MTPFCGCFLCPGLGPGLTGCRGFRDADGGRTGTCLFRGWPSPDGTGTPSHGRRKAAGPHDAWRSMTGVSLTASRENEGASATRLHSARRAGSAAALEPEHPGEGYSLEEAKTEAGRCLQCECLICVRECLYMQKYKGYPRVYARQMYNNAAIVKGHHQANTMINSCTLCGQCEVLCPEGFSMADLCLSFREDMVRRGMMPPSAHEFALEDIAAANGPECALSFAGSGADGRRRNSADRCFSRLPACGRTGEQVWPCTRRCVKISAASACCCSAAAFPRSGPEKEKLFAETVEALKSTWESLGRPRVIAACASCCKTLREALPEASVVSLWEVLDTECPCPSREEACCGGVHVEHP
ncbi:MAG: 4Fe-4S dicluster domain-containing protein [Bilophila wadsworthia]